jgi:uncharacterized membrane protein YedE/YeeE
VNDTVNPTNIVLWGGFALAFVFGAVANKSNFCIMGAVSDVVNMGHWGRMRMWLLTIAVALIGANLLYFAGLIDLSKSVYRRPTIPWLSLLVGGSLFGVGMTLAAGCVNKNLIRFGAGSLRSLVVLAFMAIAAYMTLKGLFAQWRTTWLDPVAIDLSSLGMKDQGLPALLARASGLPERSAILAATLPLGAGLLLFVFSDKRFRGNALQVLGSLTLGLLVVAAWYLSGHIGHGENPDTLETVYFATNTRTIESMSFVAPTAYTLELLMLWTDKSLHLSLGIATVLGVVAGSFVYALASGKFQWEGFASLSDLRSQLAGAVLMGFGGVTAMGCTVGQGMSGLSTLAIGSFIAVAGIVAGAVATMKVMLWREG